MRSRTLFVAAALAGLTPLQAQERTTIHYWSFNTSPQTGAAMTDALVWPAEIPADVGNGMLTHTFAAATSFVGTPVGALPNIEEGRDFAVPAGPALVNNERHMTLQVSTRGYAAVELSMATVRSDLGFVAQTVSYSVDGGRTFVPFVTIADLPPGIYVPRRIDFSAVPGASDNPSFQIRIAVSGAADPAGVTRWDNLSVSGIMPVGAPAPAPPPPAPQRRPVPTAQPAPPPPAPGGAPRAAPVPEARAPGAVPARPVERLGAPPGVTVVPPTSPEQLRQGVTLLVTPARPGAIDAIEYRLPDGTWQPTRPLAREAAGHRVVTGPFPETGPQELCVRIVQGGEPTAPLCRPLATAAAPAARAVRLVGDGWVDVAEVGRVVFVVDIRRAAPGTSPVGHLRVTWPPARGVNEFRSTSFTIFTPGRVTTVSGTGTLDGTPGYSFTAIIEDREPDRVQIEIRPPDAGAPVLSVPRARLGGGGITLRREP
jgi:hypothetical protein